MGICAGGDAANKASMVPSPALFEAFLDGVDLGQGNAWKENDWIYDPGSL
jgi:hypothetical protein